MANPPAITSSTLAPLHDPTLKQHTDSPIARFFGRPTHPTNHSYTTVNMSAQPESNQGAAAAEGTGKGKAPAEVDMMQESMDEDSSDESGAEEQVCCRTRVRIWSATS